MAKYKKGEPCGNSAPEGDGSTKQSRPIPPWPLELDFERARRILFPDDAGDDDFPRMSWRAGKGPDFKDEEDRPAIDRFISEFKNNIGPRKVRLLSPEKLAKKGISCPYFEARLGVLQAVKHATMENRRAPQARRQKTT